MPDDALTSIVFSTTSTGTGSIVAGTAVNGYRLPPAILNGRPVSYEIENADRTERENGRGRWTAGTNTLTRDTVVHSTNGGALVNFSAGTKTVSFVDLPGDPEFDGRETRLDIRAFGAIPAGSGANVAANTAAIEAAVAEAHSRRGGVEVYIPHNTAFDPSSIEWRWEESPGVFRELGVAVALAGEVYPTVAWDIQFKCRIRGAGGTDGTQYHGIWRNAIVRRPAGLAASVATVSLTTNHPALLEDFEVEGKDGTAIRLSGGALKWLKNVAVYCDGQVDTCAGFKICDNFWIWLEHCAANVVGTVGKASIWFTREQAGFEGTGLIYIRDLITSGAPILFDRGANASRFGEIYIDNVTAENNGNRPMIKVLPDTELQYLRLNNVQSADSDMTSLIDNQGKIFRLEFGGTYDVKECRGQMFSGNLPIKIRYESLGLPERRFGPTAYPKDAIIFSDGEIETTAAFRGMTDILQACPLPRLNVSQDPAVWRIDTGATLTQGFRDPDGFMTAARVTNTSAGWWAPVRFDRPGTGSIDASSLAVGDHLIFGVWARNHGNGVDQVWNTRTLFVAAPGGGSLRLDGLDNLVVDSEAWRLHGRGWVPIVGRAKVTAVGTDLEFEFTVDTGYTVDLWRPFVLHAPGATYTEHEVERWRATLSRVYSDIAPGHVGLRPEVTFKTGRGTTADRPDAEAVGEGASWWDEDIGRPVWVDGAGDWRYPLLDGENVVPSDESIEVAYHNRVGIVEETEATDRLSTITRRWTAERVGQSAAAAIAELTDGQFATIDDPTDYSITAFEVSAGNSHDGTALEVRRRNQVRRLIGANGLVRFSAANLQPGDYGQIVNATGVALTPSAGTGVTLYGNGAVADGDSFAWIVQTATGAAAEVYVLRAQESAVSYDFGTQVNPGDENVVYSRATHGDAPAFWYDVALSAGRTLTFPIAEGVEGGICLIRCRTTVGANDLTVRLEDAANPGTYVDLPLPAGHTRILRKEAASPSWWTDFGFFQNAAQVNHQFASQAEMEAGTEPTARSMSPQRVAQAIAALAPVGGGGGVTGVTEPSVLVNASTLLSDASHATVVSGSNLVQRKVRVLHSTPASSVALTFNTTLTRSVNLLVMDDQVGAVTVQPVSGATWEDGTTTTKNLVVGSGETGSAVLEPLGNNNEFRLIGDVVEDKGVAGNFHVGGNLTVSGTSPGGGSPATSDVQFAATARVLGRTTAGAGGGEELTAAQAKTLLAIAVGDVSGAAPLASPAFTGNPTEQYFDAGTKQGAVTIDYTQGTWQSFVCGTGNITSMTISNPPTSGRVGQLTLEVINHASTPRTIAWGAAFRFPGGTDATLTAATNAIDIFTLVTRNGGTNWFVFEGGKAWAP